MASSYTVDNYSGTKRFRAVVTRFIVTNETKVSHFYGIYTTIRYAYIIAHI